MLFSKQALQIYLEINSRAFFTNRGIIRKSEERWQHKKKKKKRLTEDVNLEELYTMNPNPSVISPFISQLFQERLLIRNKEWYYYKSFVLSERRIKRHFLDVQREELSNKDINLTVPDINLTERRSSSIAMNHIFLLTLNKIKDTDSYVSHLKRTHSKSLLKGFNKFFPDSYLHFSQHEKKYYRVFSNYKRITSLNC